MSAVRGYWSGCLAWLLLSGCTVLSQQPRQAETAAQQARQLVSSVDGLRTALADPASRHAAQEVAVPWLAGRAVPLAREVTLPPALRREVATALMFPDARLDLLRLSERITEATGLPVRVQPEALLPASQFLPRLAAGVGEAAATQATDTPPASLPMPSGMHPLPDILDRVAARLDVQWAYHDGVLTFYRTRTETFNVRAWLGQASAQLSLGREGDADGGFRNSASTHLTLPAADPLDAVLRRIEPLLTRAGLAQGDGVGSSRLIVTDTPAALQRVADFLEQENRVMTRRVRLLFEEITVARHDNGEAALDWQAVYQLAQASLQGAVSGGAPLNAAGAGMLAAQATTGRWSGSEAVVRALSAVGVVQRHVRVPLVTLNRRPVTHAVRTTFSWIDQVQAGATATLGQNGASAALPNVTVSQQRETVGQFLTLVPDAQADGQVLLSLSYDTTVAQPLTSVTFGQGAQSVQVQQLTVDGSGTVQQVELRAGQTLVVSGFDREQQQNERRRLDASAPWWLGGSTRQSQERLTTLVLISADVEDGP